MHIQKKLHLLEKQNGEYVSAKKNLRLFFPISVIQGNLPGMLNMETVTENRLALITFHPRMQKSK